MEENGNYRILVSLDNFIGYPNYRCFQIMKTDCQAGQIPIAYFARPLRSLRYKRKFFLNAVSPGTAETAGESEKLKIKNGKPKQCISHIPVTISNFRICIRIFTFSSIIESANRRIIELRGAAFATPPAVSIKPEHYCFKTTTFFETCSPVSGAMI